jgi:hypothetical protein
MRRYGLAAMLLAAVGLMASGVWAEVPDCNRCTVGSGIINACPYDHVYGTTDAERYQDIVVTLYTENDDPVEEFPASRFQFTVTPHSSYPSLGGGVSGDCPNCETKYTVQTQYTETNALGEMLVRVSVGSDCSPSMCCPVEIAVNLVDACEIPVKISILQNSHDLVANGDVRGPDFGAFATAFNLWTGSATRTPASDFVWVSSPPQGAWGEVSGPDFGAFATHFTDCCGHLKEGNPANCDAWTDPCP